jgi:hypothetical protein
MQFFYQFILGIVLGYILIKTGSIIASMFVHFLNNTIVVVYNYISPTSTPTFNATSIILSFVIAIASAGVLILLIHWLKPVKKKAVDETDYDNIYVDKKFSSQQSKTIFWIACALAIAIWGIGTFIQ